MKICRKCREEFANDINFCPNDLDVLRTVFNIQKTATKVNRNTNLNYGRNTQFNEAMPTATPLPKIEFLEFLNVSTYKSESKIILALKLWSLFAILLVGSILFVVSSFTNH